jgi:hypothetical protein
VALVAVLVAIGLIRGGPLEQKPWSLPQSLPTGTIAPVLAPEPGPQRAPIPSSGPGTFAFDDTTGPVLGEEGQIKRFRLAVESNVDAELADFSRFTDETLGDERSWIFEKRQRFQRVPGNGAAGFTIALVTRETAYRLCARAGLDIREAGIPYTSCQANNWVVINLDRWRLATPEYAGTGTPLAAYRQYVLNHEVGHQLGRRHERCPGVGEPAPVMQQQTLSLQGCVPNSWPYPDAVT